MWDNEAGQGNYWRGYVGADTGEGVGRLGEARIAGDGIGDTGVPHRGVDWYPFLARDGWLGPGPDTTAPETTIVSATGAAGTAVADGASTPSTTLVIAFTGTDDVGLTSFECSLDGAAFAGCRSPTAYHGIALGDHSFAVRGVDDAGNRDVTPASIEWTVVSATGALADLTDVILGLAPTTFANGNRAIALSRALNAVINQLDGRGGVCGAINLIEHDILPKTDGDANTTDWVTDAVVQQALEDMLLSILAALREQAAGRCR